MCEISMQSNNHYQKSIIGVITQAGSNTYKDNPYSRNEKYKHGSEPEIISETINRKHGN